MATKNNHKQTIEFGDFQTPPDLAAQVCSFLFEQGSRPAALLEPTCGQGNLLLAALDKFPSIRQAIGFDINKTYIDALCSKLQSPNSGKVLALQADFFELDWAQVLNSLESPLLILGNPPWVTNSDLTTLGSTNLPTKLNFQKLSGFEAKTGKSNFDISEWMLIRLLELNQNRDSTLAMLCKTSVARRTLLHVWREKLCVGDASIYRIDAKTWFGASVDACLFVCKTNVAETDQTCRVFNALSLDAYQTTFGFMNQQLIADVPKFEKWNHLAGHSKSVWRSGIKHDCSGVMELTREGDCYQNGLAEACDLEDTYLYPMLKGSQIAKNKTPTPSRYMIVTQKNTGDETLSISRTAPKTWTYLLNHAAQLDNRKSSLYRNRPRFSIFGIGEYAFAPWKVAISALYKRLHFNIIPPFEGKCVMLDDTCNFISCQDEDQAIAIAEYLNSEPATEFLESLIFWDSKRPITVDVLRHLDLTKLSNGQRSSHRAADSSQQKLLFPVDQ